MSVSFTGYLIEIDRLRMFCDSVDGKEVQVVLSRIANIPLFQRGAEETKHLNSAVANLATGQYEKLNPESALLSLQCVCATFGEMLENDLLIGVHSGLLDEIGRGAELLFNRGAPFPLGKLILKEGMGYLTNAELPPHLAEVNRLLDDFPADGDPDVMATIETMIAWYEGAVDAKTDIVGFWN